MAAPNIVNVTSIYGKTMGAALGTTTTTDILSCAANKVLKINSIIVANVDGTNAADVTVYFWDNSVGARYALASTIAVPATLRLLLSIRTVQFTLKNWIKLKSVLVQVETW